MKGRQWSSSMIFSDLILHKDSITNATSISLPGFSSTFLPNHPILPRKTENVEIPSTYRVANITYSAQQDTIIGHCAVAPARITNSKTQTIEMLADAQSTNKVIWPSKIIEWNKSNTYRDLQFASIILTPIRCNTETGHIYITKHLTVNIVFEDLIQPYSESASQHHDISAEEISELIDIPFNDVFNINSNQGPLRSRPDLNTFVKAPGYLIVCPESFKQAADKLAAWKRLMGFNTTVKSISVESALDTIAVQNCIEDAYYADFSLKYVLLLGGGYQIAPRVGKYPIVEDGKTLKYYTDFYYACMDGEEDLFPDLIIGRLPAHTLNEALIMVNKSINYEKNPPLSNDEYFNSMIHAAHFAAVDPYDKIVVNTPDVANTEGRRFVKTSEDILSCQLDFNYNPKRIYSSGCIAPKYWSDVFANGQEIPSFLQVPQFRWNGDLPDIINSVNAGARYLFYRGHGHAYGWEAPDFNGLNMECFTNRDALPVLFNITCLAGLFKNDFDSISDYDANYDNQSYSLTESLLNYDKGGIVGAIAANMVSLSGPNDYFVAGMFDAMYPDPGLYINMPVYPRHSSYPVLDSNRAPVLDLGSVMKIGKEKMCEAFGLDIGATPIPDTNANKNDDEDNEENNFHNDIKRCRYNAEIYHCLADPSIKLYRQKPTVKAISTESGNGITYLTGCANRTVVKVNKLTNEVTIRKPNREDVIPITGYMNDHYIAVIGEDYVPEIYNSSDNDNMGRPSCIVNSVTSFGGEFKVEYTASSAVQQVSAVVTDLLGNRYSTAIGSNGILRIRRILGTCILTVYCDGQKIYNKIFTR